MAIESLRLDATFAALGDPTRRAILARLALGGATVSELARPFPFTQPTISKHLKVLEAAGLISRRRSATSRLSHLEAAPMRAANEYIERYRRFWAGSFDRLDSALAAFQSDDASEATDE